MENSETSQDKKTDRFLWIQRIFWIVFIAVPIFTGLLAYHWLPNESPILAGGEVIAPNEIISSHQECNDNNCEEVADVWRDTNTGKVYTHDDFKSHRNREKVRMALVWFSYGLLGCFFYAGVEHHKKKDFFKYFGIAVFINIIITLFAVFL